MNRTAASRLAQLDGTAARIGSGSATDARDGWQRRAQGRFRASLEVGDDLLRLRRPPAEQQVARRLRQRPAPPQHHEHRYGRDDLGPPPTRVGQRDHEPADQGRADEPEGEEAGQGAEEPAAPGGGHELGEERGDDRALGSGAQPGEHAGADEHRVVRCGRGDEREDAVEDQRVEHDAAAPDPVAEDACDHRPKRNPKGVADPMMPSWPRSGPTRSSPTEGGTRRWPRPSRRRCSRARPSAATRSAVATAESGPGDSANSSLLPITRPLTLAHDG